MRSTLAHRLCLSYLLVCLCAQLSFARVPKLLQKNWTWLPSYPIGVGESQGTIVNGELVVVGGYISTTEYHVTNAVHALNVSNPNRGWRRLPDSPFAFTHAAQAVIGPILYMCGGYKGKHPGPAMSECFTLNMKTSKWGKFPSLPAPRAGGGMVYNAKKNSLFFASGATREGHTFDAPIDHGESYLINLGSLWKGWQPRARILNPRNHMAGVDINGRYFFVGGQHGRNEDTGNQATLEEYNFEKNFWTARASMPYPVGHISASTVKYGTGFLVIAGVTQKNGLRTKTNSIVYYDVPTAKWYTIGKYSRAAQTPVCGISSNVVFCGTADGVPYGSRSMFSRPIGY